MPSPYAPNTFAGDGTQVNWDISFSGGFISRDHVKASVSDALDNVTPVELIWNTDSNVTVTPAVPLGSTLTIFRVTPTAEPLVVFHDNGILSEANLNTANRQALLAVAELASSVSGSDGGVLFPGLPTFISSLLSSAGSTLIGFLHAGTGAVKRTIQAKLRDTLSVKDFGATGNGDTDDRVAIQAALDAGSASGRTVVFPSGTYRISSPGLLVQNVADSTLTNPRVSIRGEGARGVILKPDTGDFTCIDFTGTQTGIGAEAQVVIEGLFIDKAGTLGTGIVLRNYAHITVKHVRINGGDIGVYMDGIQESLLVDVVARWCRGGLYGKYSEHPNFATSPNQITLLNCKFANNRQYGIDIVNATAFLMLGGSIEGNNNSITPGSTTPCWGARLLLEDDLYTEGAAAGTFVGVYFEQNGLDAPSPTPTGDIWLVNNASPTTLVVQGCTFQRHLVHYTTNCIRVAATDGITTAVTVQGCGFRGFNGYVASADRSYVALFGNRVRPVALGNVYASGLEVPDFSLSRSVSSATQVAAIGRFDGASAVSGAITPQQQQGVKSIVKASTGVYTINYAAPMAGANNIPVVSILSGQGFMSVLSEDDLSIKLQTLNAVGTPTDYAISFAIYGQDVASV